MDAVYKLNLPPRWVSSEVFDQVLLQSGEPHEPQITQAVFCFVSDCKVMVDAAVRILSLVNQLASTDKRVKLVFDDGEIGTMGYLNRLGFFDLLSRDVDTTPERPAFSGAALYGGTNINVVEIAKINPTERDESLPTRLADSLEASYSRRPDRKALGKAAFTIFAELVDNVFQHSATELDGFAALQTYHNGKRAQVVVSDSGKGILDTLRPAIQSMRLSNLSDTDLIVEIFRQGISRHGNIRGCGLKESAVQAIKYNAELSVRLPTSGVRLIPSPDGYKPNMALCQSGLPLIWGTHICFYFRLD